LKLFYIISINILDSLINCRNLTKFYYSNYEVELTVRQIHFLEWIENKKLNNSNYYNDKQNVHNSSVQKSLISSINNLLKYLAQFLIKFFKKT
jgi:hypothetical protein